MTETITADEIKAAARAFSPPVSPGTTIDLHARPLKLTLPMPPSTNRLYATVFKRRVLSAEGKKYKAFVRARVPALRKPCEWIALHIAIYVPLYYKNGNRRKLDVSNRIKVVEDAICEALGIDDSAVRLLTVRKIDGAENHVVVGLFEEID